MTRRIAAVALLAATGCATASKPTRMETPAANPIVQTGAEVLRRRAEDVAPERIATPEIQALIARMIEAMRAAPGVGLAAPQIGVPLRIFVVEDTEERMAALTPVERAERERTPVGPRVFINPEVTAIGAEKATFFEGCLSVAGYAALVTRAREVEVRALDEKGQPVVWRVRGWPARILQHEADHLNGTLYLDRMHSRSFSTAAHAKERFAGRPIAEILAELGL